MCPIGLPSPVNWARFRTMGIDLVIVGILVLLVSAGFAFSADCPTPATCALQVDWPTVSPALGLIAAGLFLTYMARRKGPSAP